MTCVFPSRRSVGFSLIALSLTACLQDHAAPIEYRGNWFYGPNGTVDGGGNEMPKYSDDFRANLPQDQEVKYKSGVQQYGTAAEVAPVETADLAPPTAVTSSDLAPPTTVTTSAMATAPVTSSTVTPSTPVAEAPKEDSNWLSSVLDSAGREDTTAMQDQQAPGRTPAPSIGKKPEPASTVTTERAQSIAEGSGTPEFIWPLRGTILSKFGAKLGNGTNDGINIAARSGEPTRAAGDGIVVYADNAIKGFGNMVIIKHEGGWLSAYAHASELVVKKGDEVIRGQLIGFVGQTGNVTQPQLHFSLRKNKQPVNPEQYLVNK